MSGVIQAINHDLGSGSFDLLVAIGIFLLAITISAFAVLLLKYFGFFEIKDPKLNAELAEADTDFYRKNSSFSPEHQEREKAY